MKYAYGQKQHKQHQRLVRSTGLQILEVSMSVCLLTSARYSNQESLSNRCIQVVKV